VSGAACLTGPDGKLEVGRRAAGVCTADEFDWLIHLGAVVLHRWRDGHALLTTDHLDEGELVHVVKGKIVRGAGKENQ